MSSWFKIEMTLVDYVPGKEQDIEAAVCEHWNFDDAIMRSHASNEQMLLVGEDKASGDLEEKIREILQAAWAANGGYCKINIQSLYLEDLPYEMHPADEKVFAELWRKP